MENDELKDQLAASYEVVGWEPSTEELQEISQKIHEAEPETASELAEIVQEVHPIEHGMLDGINNSDLDTVLLMATQMAQPK